MIRLMSRTGVFFLFAFLLMVRPPTVYPQAARTLFNEAKRKAFTGSLDFAFMGFERLLREYPQSKYAQGALFAAGEYYFILADYRNARKHLLEFIERYPESEAYPFALAYLLRLAKDRNDQESINELEAKIVGFKQISLLFREFKELAFTSALARTYKLIYFIDRAEIYVEDELFETVSF